MSACYDKNVISVVIPSRNSADLLRTHLPHNYRLMRAEADELGMSVEVVFVFEETGDGSVEVVTAIVDENLVAVRTGDGSGYGGKCNRGVTLAKGHWILILTTDVELQPGFVKPMLQPLKRGTVFSVSPRIIRPLEQFRNESITWGKFRRHQIEVVRTLEKHNNDKAIERNILWPCGAVFLTTKHTYEALSGFSDEYLPGYSEDVDLGIRAWESELSCIYTPDASAYHWHNSTFKQQGESYVNFLLIRNHALLNLKFLPWVEKFLFLLKKLFKAARGPSRSDLKPILAAINIWRKNKKMRTKFTLSRQDLLNLLAKSK